MLSRTPPAEASFRFVTWLPSGNLPLSLCTNWWTLKKLKAATSGCILGCISPWLSQDYLERHGFSVPAAEAGTMPPIRAENQKVQPPWDTPMAQIYIDRVGNDLGGLKFCTEVAKPKINKNKVSRILPEMESIHPPILKVLWHWLCQVGSTSPTYSMSIP